MFTHPALLREMNLLSEHLRRSGEADWSRRVIQTADRIRKSGWTDEGLGHAQALFKGEPNLYQVSFGDEHQRWLNSAEAQERANQKLERQRLRVLELAEQPVVAFESGPRKRSPDLEPIE